jgi:hypothetical protein
MPQLTVLVPYEFTAVHVVDSLCREMASGTGSIEVPDLSPGIYRVVARIPGAVDDRLVVVSDDHRVDLSGGGLRFDSLAPLPSAASYNSYFEEVATIESRNVHVDALASGESGGLFIFIRTDGGSRENPPVLTLQTGTGETIAHIEQGMIDPGKGCCALSVALSAGSYLLTHEVPGLGLRGQVVFVEAGWETQVFVPWEPDHADLSRALVTMVPAGSGFIPTQPWHYDQVEAAQDGLARGELVLTKSQEWAQLHTGDLSNPMLTLVSAYAQAMQEADMAAWSRITDNLLRLLPNSPDAHLLHGPEAAAGRAFETPPMFAWGMEELLLRRAANDASLVSADSWTAAVAATATTGSVWTRCNLDVDIGRQTTRLLMEAGGGAHLSDEELARRAGLPLSVVTCVPADA